MNLLDVADGGVCKRAGALPSVPDSNSVGGALSSWQPFWIWNQNMLTCACCVLMLTCTCCVMLMCCYAVMLTCIHQADNISAYRLWVALEAASGILSEHQGSPTAVFGVRQGSWNVTMDPHTDDGAESPLWAFSRSRALNRLSLRTKLAVTTSENSAENAAAAAAAAVVKVDHLADYTIFPKSNCYNEGHGGVVLPGHAQNQTAASCAALCTAYPQCDCVTFQARAGAASQHQHVGDCWLRASCQPARFERDNMTQCYDVYVKKTAPTPPPASRSGGAIAYLKLDALGPEGDAAVVLFNPGAAQTLAVDLSALPPAVLASRVAPPDLFTNVTASNPLAATWTVHMKAASFAAFGFKLDVFPPWNGKFRHCTATDGYSKQSTTATTLQACFLECQQDRSCKNVFVAAASLPKWLEKPAAVSCTLLGTVTSTATACVGGGAGTLVAALSQRPAPPTM